MFSIPWCTFHPTKEQILIALPKIGEDVKMRKHILKLYSNNGTMAEQSGCLFHNIHI